MIVGDPASVVRLLYGETRRGESRATALSLKFDTRPLPSVKATVRRMPRMVSVLRSPSPDIVVDLVRRDCGSIDYFPLAEDTPGTRSLNKSSIRPRTPTWVASSRSNSCQKM